VNNQKIEIVKCEINMVRTKLENLLSERNLTSDEVQVLSRELDNLIVVYQKLIMRKELS